MWGIHRNEYVQSSLLRACRNLACVGMRTVIAAVLPEACIVVQPKSKSCSLLGTFLAACGLYNSLLLFSTLCLIQDLQLADPALCRLQKIWLKGQHLMQSELSETSRVLHLGSERVFCAIWGAAGALSHNVSCQAS